jgi:hypothetical protein
VQWHPAAIINNNRLEPGRRVLEAGDGIEAADKAVRPIESRHND